MIEKNVNYIMKHTSYVVVDTRTRAHTKRETRT